MTSTPIAGSGRQSIYTGRTTSWTMVAATCVGALLIVVMAKDSEGAWSSITVPLVLVAIGVVGNVLTSSSVRVTAGPNGFTVRWGIIGWPYCHYRADEIQLAEVIDISWWRVSGGLWWTPKPTCHTVRNGPTVRLVLHNGRTVTVTVPDPPSAVAAIQSASGEPPQPQPVTQDDVSDLASPSASNSSASNSSASNSSASNSSASNSSAPSSVASLEKEPLPGDQGCSSSRRAT